MACEIFTREFKKGDGTEMLVAVRQLSASKALELHVELVSKVGNPMFPLIDNVYNFHDLCALMRTNQTEVVTKLIKDVVCTANVNGAEIKPAMFDMLFNGELMVVFEIFAFVLEANFKSFFRQGREMNERRLLEAEALSKLEEQKLIEKTSQTNTPT